MVPKARNLRGHSSGSKSQSTIRVDLKTQALDHCSTAEIHFYEARGPAFKFLQPYHFRNTLRRPLLASALVKRLVLEGATAVTQRDGGGGGGGGRCGRREGSSRAGEGATVVALA